MNRTFRTLAPPSRRAARVTLATTLSALLSPWLLACDEPRTVGCASDDDCAGVTVCNTGRCGLPYSDPDPDAEAADDGDADAGPGDETDSGPREADGGPPGLDGGPDDPEPASPLSLASPADFAELPTATPELVARVHAEGDALVRFSWGEDPTPPLSEASAWVIPDENGEARHALTTPLADGSVRWWLAEISQDGGASWTAPQSPRSFAVNLAVHETRWLQTSAGQLDRGAFTDTDTQVELDGEVFSVTPSGTYVGGVARLDELGAARWSVFAQSHFVVGDQTARVKAQLEYGDGEQFKLVPSDLVPGNDKGFNRPFTDLSALDPDTYGVLRARYTFLRIPGEASPELRDAAFVPFVDRGYTAIENAGFEAPLGAEWTVVRTGLDSSLVVDLAADEDPYEGARYARIEVLAEDFHAGRAGALYQVVTIPPDATTLSYALRHWRDAWGSRIQVRVADAVLHEVHCAGCETASAGWEVMTHDISPWQGQTVKLELRLDDSNGYWSGNSDHDAFVDVDDLVIQ